MFCLIFVAIFFISANNFEKAEAAKSLFLDKISRQKATKNYNIRFNDEQINDTNTVCITSKVNRKISAEEVERKTRNIEDGPLNLSREKFLKNNEVIETQFTNILIICPKINTNRSS